MGPSDHWPLPSRKHPPCSLPAPAWLLPEWERLWEGVRADSRGPARAPVGVGTHVPRDHPREGRPQGQIRFPVFTLALLRNIPTLVTPSCHLLQRGWALLSPRQLGYHF